MVVENGFAITSTALGSVVGDGGGAFCENDAEIDLYYLVDTTTMSMMFSRAFSV